MKIEFDKALLWLVPYLYLVSIMYYLGYWGTFGIDAFNYYEVSDLVKGVAAALGLPMLFVLLGCFIIFVGTWISDDTIKRRNLPEKRKAKVLLIIGVIFILLTIILYAFFIPGNGKVEVNDFNGLFIILFLLALIFSLGVATELGAGKTYKVFAMILCVAFLISYLPCSAFIAGKKNAFKISQDKEYDYVIADSLDGNRKSIYKYLGKTGDYYVLTDLKNIKRIVVSADKLNPLLVDRLSLNDTASVRRLKVHRKELAALVQQKAVPKNPVSSVSPPQPMQPK